MYLDNNFSMQAAQYTLALQQEIVERRRAEEAAQAANRAKSAFLANMSHELRSPLNAILGFAKLMSRSNDLFPEHQENVQAIVRNGEHLLTLINQVLDLSKIDAGRTTVNENKFDLHQLLDDLKNMFQLIADDKGLELLFHREQEVPRYVRGDEVKLRQILINLLSNALKFTSTGGVTLYVRGEERILAPYSLHFEISDTGCGIAESELDNIFEPFVQTTTGQEFSEGTGLGLTIVRSLVQLMGGDISVSSCVGCGSTFQFYLPTRVVKTAPLNNQQATRRIIAVAPNQPQYRILVVDNHRDNRQLLMKLLSPLNFELQEASNPPEAIAMWNDWKPHLIFMTLPMPVSNGIDAIQRIRFIEQQQNSSFTTKIIALSTDIFEDKGELFLSTGCDDFIRKPFQLEDIFEAIHKHLGVSYVYDESTNSSKTNRTVTNEANVLTKNAIDSLPKNLVTNLHGSLLALDVESIQKFIHLVSEFNPSLSQVLDTLARNFQYEKLLDFIQSS
ncbi:response regulator [Scytonema sp. UIC 10036]|uniref:ATP-binding response regulator n=1 Tax=Scytonema sp. UIC 10036 TaxID=2304196 RepID=UPI0012DAE74B|nr:ATP-binding protein [Scytonema sp. UIC 10036]MUG99977.1 response regulator [Scytonema sp. UIC 10036]